MKRELKFRALMRMRTENDGHGDKNFVYSNGIGGDWFSPHGKYYGEVVYESISQYTGFKDKRGEDIYEGDLVEFMYKKKEVAGKHQPVQCEIIWNTRQGMWSLKWSDGYINNFSLICDSELVCYKYEVVGNVYEEKITKDGKEGIKV